MSETKKPLIFADERTDAERFDPNVHRGTLDPSRIPGYSEVVMANDIDKADDLEFRRANGFTKEEMYRKIGASPARLPVEFQWLRVSGAGGAHSAGALRELDYYQNREGFRLATEDDLTSHGYGFPPAARRAEDGTIRRGPDVALYVRSGEVARMWETFKFREQKELEGAGGAQTFNPGTEVSASEEDRESITIKH